jgi:trans-2,3-dihydro-3-hydroxyanthranilate isomerase
MRLAFRILNVFTVDGERLSGNPLCVFEDARGIDAPRMQALARQLNLSETTFVLPSERATARVRIFTPTFEMPFAGHPTLGTAYVVRMLAGTTDVTLEMKAGIVPVTFDGGKATLRAAKAPVTRAPAASRAELARMLSLPEDAIAGEPLWVDAGVEQLVIPLATAEHVRDATPVPALIAKHGYSESRDEAMAYVWARAGAELVVRFFFTQHDAVIEDPATGSACANLGGYMLATGREPPFAETLSQGTAVGRPSQLGLGVAADRGIHVSGTVVELGTGAFEL